MSKTKTEELGERMVSIISINMLGKEFSVLGEDEQRHILYLVTQLLKAFKELSGAFVDREAELPDIPDFQYEKPRTARILKAGAIRYSRKLSGWHKTEEIEE